MLHSLDRRTLAYVRQHPPAAVYDYGDGALACFEAARSVGCRRIRDLPICYWNTARRLLCAEGRRRADGSRPLPILAGFRNRSSVLSILRWLNTFQHSVLPSFLNGNKANPGGG